MRRSDSNRRGERLSHPLDGSLQQLQPLFVASDGLYVAAGTPSSSDPSLVTAHGNARPFRRLCDLRVVRAHAERSNREGIRARISAGCAERRAGQGSDPLTFFSEVMVPGLAVRDCGEDIRYQDVTEDRWRHADTGDPFVGFRCGLPSEFAPELPVPSLCILGRAWRLIPATRPPVSVHVRYRDGLLTMTGEYIALATMLQEWESVVSRFCKSAASGGTETVTSERLGAARKRLAESGVVMTGDFLYLPTNPSRVGCVIPPHHNRTLGRHVDRELALTAPLGFPPAIPENGALSVYQRDRTGHWMPLHRSICLGALPSLTTPSGLVEGGVSLLAYLRFGAVRIAANGQFHEYDGRED
jgi:hypothetical protein